MKTEVAIHKKRNRILARSTVALAMSLLLLFFSGRWTYAEHEQEHEPPSPPSVPITAVLDHIVLEGITGSGTVIPLEPDQPLQPYELGYTVTAPNGVQAIRAVPAVNDTSFHLIVNGATVANQTASQAVQLLEGQMTNLGVSVVSSNPENARTYTFIVYRQKPSEHFLKSLTVSPGSIGTDFAPRTTAYSATVAYNVYQLSVTPLPVDPSDTVTVNGTLLPSGTAASISLQEGNNAIAVKVVSSSQPSSSSAYTLKVHRRSHDELQSLASDVGVPIRPFSPDQRLYEVDVPNGTDQIRLVPEAIDPARAGITVNGASAVSGQPSQPLALNEGSNTFPVTVNGKTVYNVSVYREPAADTVAMIDNGSSVTIRNAAISATFDKSSSKMTEMHKPGERDIIGSGMGYFYLNPYYYDANGVGHQMGFSPGTGDAEFHIASQTSDMIDMYFSFDHVSTDLIGPLKWQLHFVFQTGKSGFYHYITARMPDTANTPGKFNWSVGQVRWSVRADADLFTHVQNEGGPAVKLPVPVQTSARYQIMDATYRQPDNSGYTKYSMVNSEGYTHYYGMLGERYGIWFIKAGNDYTNGLPSAQEIGAHQTDTTPIVNWAPSAAHYGRSTAVVTPGWSHIWGPIRVYLNEANSMNGLYEDVAQTTKQEITLWPYAWLADPLYAFNDRGTVSGKLTVKGEEEDVSPSKATVVLAAPSPDWQFQDTYVYYATPDRSGHFTIPHVRAGSYTMYVFAPGIFEQMRKDGITVSANAASDVGNVVWDAKPQGEKLWQIGIPDRTAAEYVRGDQYRQWGLWLRYPFDFPNGVDYYVGKSDYRKDWNYAQPLNKTPGQIESLLVPFSNDPATWKVHFKVGDDARKNSQGLLTIGVASSRSGSVDFTLNGTKIGNFTPEVSDSAFPREGIKGIYSLLKIPFDVSLLKAGENVLSLVPTQRLMNDSGQRITDTYSAVMYDSIKMELIPSTKLQP